MNRRWFLKACAAIAGTLLSAGKSLGFCTEYVTLAELQEALIEGWESPYSWRAIKTVKIARDFKRSTSYRLSTARTTDRWRVYDKQGVLWTFFNKGLEANCLVDESEGDTVLILEPGHPVVTSDGGEFPHVEFHFGSAQS